MIFRIGSLETCGDVCETPDPRRRSQALSSKQDTRVECLPSSCTARNSRRQVLYVLESSLLVSKEVTDVLHDCLRLFPSGEVSAAGVIPHLLEIVVALRPAARC